MEDYVGKICPVCGQEITTADKVVVCPECGIPHHASCWAQNRGCSTSGCAQQGVVKEKKEDEQKSEGNSFSDIGFDFKNTGRDIKALTKSLYNTCVIINLVVSILVGLFVTIPLLSIAKYRSSFYLYILLIWGVIVLHIWLFKYLLYLFMMFGYAQGEIVERVISIEKRINGESGVDQVIVCEDTDMQADKVASNEFNYVEVEKKKQKIDNYWKAHAEEYKALTDKRAEAKRALDSLGIGASEEKRKLSELIARIDSELNKDR